MLQLGLISPDGIRYRLQRFFLYDEWDGKNILESTTFSGYCETPTP